MHDITILIPTYQRPKHILRKLTHFSNAKCDIPIHIYDTSDEDIQNENRETINSFANKLDITYHVLPQSYGYSQKIFYAVAHTDTPYVVVHPDDDFLNIVAVKQCMEFLKNNSDYIYATGITLSYLTPDLGIDCPHAISFMHKNDIRGEENVFERIEKNRTSLRNKIVWHNVWRRDIFVKVIEPVTKYPYKKYTEYMLGYIAASAGRGKLLDMLYEIRIPYPKKTNRRDKSLPGFEDHYCWSLMDENYAKDLKAFSDRCGEFIQQQEPHRDINEIKIKVINAFLASSLHIKKMLPEDNLCTRVRKNKLYRKFIRYITYLKHLTQLTSRQRLKMFFALLKRYGYTNTDHMLTYDKNFQYNIITLLSGESKDSVAFKAMYESIRQYPAKQEQNFFTRL